MKAVLQKLVSSQLERTTDSFYNMQEAFTAEMRMKCEVRIAPPVSFNYNTSAFVSLYLIMPYLLLKVLAVQRLSMF